MPIIERHLVSPFFLSSLQVFQCLATSSGFSSAVSSITPRNFTNFRPQTSKGAFVKGRYDIGFACGKTSHWRASCPNLFFTARSTYRSKFCQVKSPVLLGSSSIVDSKAVNETLEGNFDEGPTLVECFVSENFPNSVQSVKARLKAHCASWADALRVNDFILRVIGKGYAIPFITFPPNACFDNNHSALMPAHFVLEAIQELILSG